MAARVAERAAEYDRDASDAETADFQLERLNLEWKRVVSSTPYYRSLVSQGRAPERFASIRQFLDTVPPVRRQDVQRYGAEMRVDGRPNDSWRITGGSTSQPVQIPAWNHEFEDARRNLWAARTWYSIDPGSRLFLLWGHSHLLGSGVKGWMNGFRRSIYDRVLGYKRFSAYDLSPERLKGAVAEIARFRPEYVIGYSVALDQLARVNEQSAAILRDVRVKAVIGTAEAFPAEDSRPRLRELFNAPVAMEYGCVEANVMAHTHPSGGFRVFWRSFILEAEPLPQHTNRAVVRVTSLHPRCFPLIRYELGDQIELELPVSEPSSVTRFRSVVGRCNTWVELPDGAIVHSEAFAHALRMCDDVRGFQVVVPDGDISLMVLADTLSKRTEDEIRSRLSRVHPALGRIPIHPVPALRQTLAGKTPMIVRSTTGIASAR